RISALKPAAPLLADAGRALLESKQYAPAKELLEQAAAASPSADVDLDLALAAFHATGAREALDRMDRVPESGRTGDYYLARAQMLDTPAAWQQALHRDSKRPDSYRQAIVFLSKAD